MLESNVNTDLVYHYTSIDAVCDGIITEQGLSFRLTHYAYLNDRREFYLGRDLFRQRLKGSVRDYVNLMEKESHYILSLSHKKDFLPMWSMYGRNGNGIMLSLTSDMIYKSTGGVLMDCMYCDEKFNFGKLEDEQYIQSCIKVYETIKGKHGCIEQAQEHLHKKLNEVVPLIKSDYFAYEEEARLVIASDTQRREKYRSTGNIIIPYVLVTLPKASLKRIMIGPTLDTERAKRSLRMFLDSKGYSNVKIDVSKAPYRG